MPDRRRVLVALALLPAFPALAVANTASYRAFAERLVSKPPAGMIVRPDMEAYLDAKASAARTGRGYPALKASDALRTAARAQAIEMAIGNYVGHQSSTGEPFRVRFEAFLGDGGASSFGENAARDRQKGGIDTVKADRLFQQWLDSAGHRNNLMNRNYQYVSTGAIQVGNHLYAVQIFWDYDPARVRSVGSPAQGGTVTFY